MAEYNITYEEIQKFVDDCIAEVPDSERLKAHRSEILAVITARNEYDSGDNIAVTDSVELWENQIGKPSELLLGTRYIVIKDSMMKFIEVALTSGLVDAIITNPQNPISGVTVGIVSGFVFALMEVLKGVGKLEDYDFCVYMQAVTHFREHKEFTVNDLKHWLPNDGNRNCNMHNSKWDCEHLLEEDKCNMLEQQHLDEALVSLYEKNVLKRERKCGEWTYTFKI